MNHILIIIAFNLILYFRTLRFSIITDDIRWYKKWEKGFPKWHEYKNKLQWISDRLYGGRTFGDNPEIDHAFTIVLHTAICTLIYIALGSNDTSFWGAMLYSCNPVNSQTSIWLNGRRYAVNIILILSSLIAWQHHAWWLAIPLWASTSLFHLTGLFAPVLWGKWWLMFLPLAFIWFKREWIMTTICHRQGTIYSKELLIFFPRRIIVVIKSYGFYFWHMIFPQKVGMYYSEFYMWGLTKWGNDDAYTYNVDFYKGTLALLCSGLGYYLLDSNTRWMALFAFFALIQWCNIIYAVQTLADRYCNMSNIFMMYFLSLLINHFYPPLVYLFIGYYVMNLKVTMSMYIDIYNFYKYHINYMPESLPNWVFYSNYLIKTQQYLHAWPIVDEGLKYHPNNFGLLYQAAQCWKGLGNKGECMKYLMRAKENYYDGQEEIQGKAIKDFIL